MDTFANKKIQMSSKLILFNGVFIDTVLPPTSSSSSSSSPTESTPLRFGFSFSIMGTVSVEENFCGEYLELKPSEGGFFDLLHLFCSSNVEHNKYVNCSQGLKVTDIRQRWLIIVSILAQKVLMVLNRPMRWLGLVFEAWIHFLASNNYSGLEMFFKLLQGKLAMPNPSSATYRSTIGNLDKRVELDKNIKFGDKRYNAALSMMAAKLAYENPAFVETTVTDHWKMEFLAFYNFCGDHQERLSTQAFLCQDKKHSPELIVVAFRGTEPFDSPSWQTDVDLSWYKLPGVGKIHGGFLKALGLQKGVGWPKEIKKSPELFAYYAIREKLREILGENDNAKFIVTGHSLGGALAILFPLILALHKEEWILKRLEGIYTFGQPRVGCDKVGEFMKEQLRLHDFKYCRFVYCNDMVPRMPYDDSSNLFKHFGTCVYFTSWYQGEIVDEQPNKNYFSILGVIPKILNAVWELLRSFIIGTWKGPDYHEGVFMKLFRMVGLILPGLPAHGPQDYVNSTRLGLSTIPLFQENPAAGLDQNGLKHD